MSPEQEKVAREKLIAEITEARDKLQAFVDDSNEHSHGLAYFSGFFQAVTLISGIMAYRTEGGHLIWAIFAAYAGASAIVKLVKTTMLGVRIRKGPSL